MMQKKRSLKKDDNPNARLQGPLPISSRAPDTILHKNFRNDRKFIELYWRIDRFALDNGNVRGPFSARLAFDNGWTADNTDRIIGDYKQFLSLLISVGHKLAPSDAVVRAWYLPMIQFRSYWDEPCEKILATKLHSTPMEGEPGCQTHRSCTPQHLKRSPFRFSS